MSTNPSDVEVKLFMCGFLVTTCRQVDKERKNIKKESVSYIRIFILYKIYPSWIKDEFDTFSKSTLIFFFQCQFHVIWTSDECSEIRDY